MTGFVLRAPWYVRERCDLDVLQPEAFRPAIQMYDGTDFVKRLLKDPRDSLKFTDEDRWSYPVPVSLVDQKKAKGRLRLATHKLVVTRMRKLYQPSHNRFYVVVVEVLCDKPGLPRAGKHDDFTVGFVMRRHHTSITGARRPTRQLARNLLRDLAKQQGVAHDGSEPPEDVRDVWWAENAGSEEFERFEEQNRDLIDQLGIAHHHQGWIAPPAVSAGWQDVDSALPAEYEQRFPMWRIPRREDDCDAAATRSTWFGIVPTYSAEHFTVDHRAFPKLDDHAVYELRCFVTVTPPKGHEHCPRAVYGGRATRPFRLADPMDPQGNSHRTTSITLPDLRRLAAQAGQPMGPGGVRITTPPNSQMVLNPFGKIPDSGAGVIGAGGGVCTFAFELFFIVAFFLFLLFLPIVVFAFQLWWMLALRFCIPPQASFAIVEKFFADGHVLADLNLNAQLVTDLGALGLTPDQAFDAQFGLDNKTLDPQPHASIWADQLAQAKDKSGLVFAADHNYVDGLLTGTDPAAALPDIPLPLETKPDDPLCGPT